MLPQDNTTPRTRQPQLQPPAQQPAASSLIDTIHAQLASRDDAEDILDAVAERLWFRSDSNADERIRAPPAVEFMRGGHSDASAIASNAVGRFPEAELPARSYGEHVARRHQDHRTREVLPALPGSGNAFDAAAGTSPIALLKARIFADCKEALQKWRDHAAKERRLHDTEATIRRRSSLSSPAPKIMGERSWEERDAGLRATAHSLSSSPARSPPPPYSAGLRFFESASELPVELANHKESNVIKQLLDAPLDSAATKWRRRHLYTEDNWADWAEWQPADKTHRDAFQSERQFSDKSKILSAPGLRDRDPVKMADAWNEYRRILIVEIGQALKVGCKWFDILRRLHSTYLDSNHGYPKLANYTKNALKDTALLRYPLLHADVLIYQLDKTFAKGSGKYEGGHNVSEWDNTLYRDHGEDTHTLAIRVVDAYLQMHDHDKSLTEENVWEDDFHRRKINERYGECLLNDRGDEARGESTWRRFLEEVTRIQIKLDDGDATVPPARASCIRIANEILDPYEEAMNKSEQARARLEAEGRDSPQPEYAGRTGAGAKARRDARRAAERNAGFAGLAGHPHYNET